MKYVLPQIKTFTIKNVVRTFISSFLFANSKVITPIIAIKIIFEGTVYKI